MKKYMLGVMLALTSCFAAAVGTGASATNQDVKMHLKVDVTIEHAHQLIQLFETQGPEAVNNCLHNLEAMKTAGYIRSYTIKSQSFKKINDCTIQCCFEAEVCVNPSASKECKILLETLIKDKSNLKMLHKVIKQEFDYSARCRSFETNQWINEVKRAITKACLQARLFMPSIDQKNPVCVALSKGIKLGVYVHETFGCHVKINDFKCETVK